MNPLSNVFEARAQFINTTSKVFGKNAQLHFSNLLIKGWTSEVNQPDPKALEMVNIMKELGFQTKTKRLEGVMIGHTDVTFYAPKTEMERILFDE